MPFTSVEELKKRPEVPPANIPPKTERGFTPLPTPQAKAPIIAEKPVVAPYTPFRAVKEFGKEYTENVKEGWKTLLKRPEQAFKDVLEMQPIRGIRGAGEAVQGFISFMGTEGLAGIAGLREAIEPGKGLKEAKKTIEEVRKRYRPAQEYLTPKTIEGQRLGQILSSPFEISKEFGEAGQEYWESKGHYNIGFSNRMLAESAPFLLPYAVKVRNMAKSRGTSPQVVAGELKAIAQKEGIKAIEPTLEEAIARLPEELEIAKPPVRVVRPEVKPPVKTPVRAEIEPMEIVKDVPPAKITEFLEPVLAEEGFFRMGKEKPETQFTGDALKVEKMYDKATEEIRQKHRKTVKKTFRWLKRNVVDVSGNLKKELMRQGDAGKKVVMHHDLIAGANSKAMRDNQLASNKIFKGLSNLEHEFMDRIIQSRRTIAIEQYKKIKHPEGLGQVEHKVWLEQLPPDLKTKLNKRADRYFEEMTKQLEELRDENIISEASYNSLVEKGDYSPRRFLQHIDPDITYTIGGRKITVPDSGIKSLDEGSYGLLEKDSSLLLSQVISRTQGRIFRNRANKALHDLAVNYPDNGVVFEAPIIKRTKKGKPVHQPTPAGFEKIKVMIDGNPKEMLMPTDMAREWITKEPILGQTQATIIRWMSGSALLKPMATGLNPEFAITNFPRDLAHIWITDYRQSYSPHLPIAMGQMMRDLVTVLPDSMLRNKGIGKKILGFEINKGRWRNYVNEGGGMEFLTHQGSITSKTQGFFKGLQTVMGYIGETSEIMPRLALRERALRKGYPSTEATWIARDYLDFSQGGSFTKAVDSGIPYLNASIQGTRGLFKAGGMKPALFTYKVAQIGALATSLFYMNRFLNQDAWEQVSPRDKVNNFIITTPYSYRDKEGNKRYVYFKIAKDQGQRVFTSIFEALAAKAIGDEVDGDQIAQAAQDAIPIIPSQSLPPTIDAFLGYTANKDFWRNEDIWRGPEVKPEEEYTPYTHPVFIRAGKLTGLSPERLKYSLTQYFTYGNVYTSMGGYAWKQILDDMPEMEREKVTEDIILRQPFIRRFAKRTDPYHKFQKKLEKIKIEESTRRHIQKREFDILSQKVYDGEALASEINSFIISLPREDRKKFKRRHKNRGRIQDIPDRRWWLNLAGMNPEARSTVYWNRWRNADEEERAKLQSHLRRVPGVLSPRFKRKLQRLKNKEIE